MILADVRKPKCIQAAEVLRLGADWFLHIVLFMTKAEKVKSLLLGLGLKGLPDGPAR